MKKFLAFLWLIIITGVVFSLTKALGPNNVEKEISNLQKLAEQSSNLKEENSQNETPKKELLPSLNSNQSYSYEQRLSQGDTLMESGYFDQAIVSYQKAADLHPSAPAPLIKLGDTYLANHEPSKAITVFKDARTLNEQTQDHDPIDIELKIAQSQINLQDYKSAKNTVWPLDQNDFRVKYYHAIILTIGGDIEGAKELFDTIALASESPELNVPNDLVQKSKVFLNAYETYSYYNAGELIFLKTLLAKALTEVKQYDSAIAVLFNVIEEKNNYTDAWIILGYSYLQTNKLADAVDALTQAKDLDDKKPETLFFLGLAHGKNSDLDLGISYLEKAEKAGFQPQEQIDLQLANLYQQKEEYQKSAARYDKFLAQRYNTEVYIKAIWIQIEKLQDGKKAVQLAEKVMEQRPDSAMSYNLLGWAYTADAQYDKAETYLTKALEIDPEFDAAILNLGWLYEKQDLTHLAKEYYKKAYVLNKDQAIINLAKQRFDHLTIMGSNT